MEATESPVVYIPSDRRRALARGQDLPDRTCGAVLFADVAGFTPLAEALARKLGPRLGAEELVDTLNLVYGVLVGEVHHHGGSVVSFSGDAVTCWFDADEGRRAVTCALAMQRATAQLAELRTRSGVAVTLAIKVGVAAGPVRRLLVGDPQIQLIDVLAGATLERMALAEEHAKRGEVVIAPEVTARVGEGLAISAWRGTAEPSLAGAGGSFGVVAGLAGSAEEPSAVVPAGVVEEAPAKLDGGQVRAWLLPPVYERLRAGQGRFLAELRPAVPLFVRFEGLDYDGDDAAGGKLDSYLRWVQGVLARYESFVLQLTCGDKGSYLYAAFGAPLAHDDDAARAVAAALELRAPPPEMAFLRSVRIGVSRGRMWVGACGGPTRRTYGVIGDEVNVAARLMEEAAPGEILVSQRVSTAAGRSHSFEYLRLVVLEGKKEPLPVYTPSARPLPSAQRPATLYKSPLVGREGELDALEEAVSAVLAGRGSVLSLQGEAGIGKSRLAAEFIEGAAGSGLRAVLGTCHSTSQGIAYTPWRQVFRVLLGLAEGPATAAGEIVQVEAAIRQSNAQWLLRLPLLGDLLDLPIPDNETTAAFGPQLRQESLFALAVGMVQAWSAGQPLLLLIEDAHWMDEASLGLTLALGRALGRVPVLLTLVHRPILPQERPLWLELERLPEHRRIVLERLTHEGIRGLVANRLGAEPAALVLSLVEALAQGNPFFAEELVDALREAGGLLPSGDGSWSLSEQLARRLREAHCLVQEDGLWVLAPDAQLSGADLGLPDSVYGIVLARMDRLPEPPKLTLKVASVIGRSFEFELLKASHPASPRRGRLLKQMETLEARDFARLETAAPRRSYLFKHSITQEVVYGALLCEQQSELHRAVGESLEKLLPDAVGRLAYHFSHSGVPDKAIHYLHRAGEQAAARYANAEAVDYFSRALALLPETEVAERYELLLAREKVLDLQGKREAQLQDLVELEALSEQSTDIHLRIEVALRRSSYGCATGDYPASIAAAQRAVALAQESGWSEGEALAHKSWGQALWQQAQYPSARAQLEQAMALAQVSSLPGVEADSLRLMGNVASYEGDRAAASAAFEQALRGYRQVGDRRGEAYALNGLAVASPTGREAGSYGEQALRLFRQVGDRRGESLVLGNLGSFAQGEGHYAQARDYHQQALRLCREIGNRYGESIALGNLGNALLSLRDYAAARTYHQEALRLYREMGDRHGESTVLNGLGDGAFQCGDYAGAGVYFRHALEICRAAKNRNSEAHALGFLCRTACCFNDFEAAREYGQQALLAAREVGSSVHEALALTSLGYAQEGLGQCAEAEDFFRQAAEIWGALGHEARIECLAKLGQVTLSRGDLAQASACVEAVLDYLSTEPALLGNEEPVQIYLACYQVLRANHDARAVSVLEQGHRLLLDLAGRIDDEGSRLMFLRNIAAHREIVAEMARVCPHVDGGEGSSGRTAQQQ